jgi:hypothetical protein
MTTREQQITPARPIHLLLVAGPKDHGVGEHDYPAWQASWATALGRARGIEVQTAFQWPAGSQWRWCDLAALYFWNHDWSDAQYRDLDDFFERGGGVVALHSAIVEDRNPARLARYFGLSGRRPELQFRHGAIELRIRENHLLADAPRAWKLFDESYWKLVPGAETVDVLATALEAGAPCPQIWTHQPRNGRVFACIPGHYAATFDDPRYRRLLARGLGWCANVPAETFGSLVTAPTFHVG